MSAWLAGLRGFARNPVAWVVVAIVFVVGVFAGWRIADQRAEVARLEKVVEDQNADIASLGLKHKTYAGLSDGVATLGRSVAEIVANLTQEQADAEAAAPPADPRCADDPAHGRTVRDRLKRASDAFGRAAGASAR